MRTITPIFAINSRSINPEGSSIEWMPAGQNTIHCKIGDDAGTITVNVSAELAQKLDAELQQAILDSESGKSSLPYIGFDHNPGPAAAHPKRFFWEDGIRLELEWTPKGRESVRNREYLYFSPTWISANIEAGEVTGLFLPGEIGSLVNTPAFQSIERLAAAHNLKVKSFMWEQELLALLVKYGVITEQQAVDKAMEEAKKCLEETLSSSVQTAVALTSERDQLKADLGTAKASISSMKASIEAERKSRIEGRISAMIASGRITESGREAVLNACLSASDDGESILSAIPETHDGHPAPLSAGMPVSSSIKPTRPLDRVTEFFKTQKKG